jgi:hypothetical protein
MTRASVCPECGRKIRPSNLERHRRAQHMPKPRPRKFGRQFAQPAIPITIGAEQDRRYDEIAPRGVGPECMRIYRLRAGELQLLATGESPEAAGLAIYTLWSEGEFGIDDSVGWLNTATEPGHWCISPWALGRRKPDDE